MNDSGIVLIGYSGHAYVCIESVLASGDKITGYCELTEMAENPYQLNYLGSENELHDLSKYFIAIGDNNLRSKVAQRLRDKTDGWQILIDPTASVSETVEVGAGVYIGKGVMINAQATIGEGTICNTGSIIEHDCRIGAFVHIAPAAILLGNVKIGDKTLIGSSAVIREGVRVGNNAIVGAGAVVLEDVEDNALVVGHPARLIKYRDV